MFYSKIFKLFFPLTCLMTFCASDTTETTGKPELTEPSEPNKVDLNPESVQKLIEVERAKVEAEFQRKIEKAEQKYESQRKRAEKAEKGGAKAPELEAELADWKARAESTEAVIAEQKSKIEALKSMSLDSELSMVIAGKAGQLAKGVDGTTKANANILKMLLANQCGIIDGKNVAMNATKTGPRYSAKTDNNGNVQLMTLEDLAEEILEQNIGLLASTSAGGAGQTGNNAVTSKITKEEYNKLPSSEREAIRKTMTEEQKQNLFNT